MEAPVKLFRGNVSEVFRYKGEGNKIDRARLADGLSASGFDQDHVRVHPDSTHMLEDFFLRF